MKLISLQIFPKGQFGWGSDLLEFGKHITQLYGPTSCGKTPVVQSIVYCLGYPCIFRNDIYERCDSAILKIENDRGIFSLKRFYTKRNVEIEVIGPNGESTNYYSEKEYSEFIFECLDLNPSNLVTNDKKASIPYLSTLLPVFYVEQDKGYSDIYCPKSNFIKDQFAEMIRMLCNLPAKNSFDVKKSQLLTKEKLDFLDRQVEEISRNHQIAKESIIGVTKSSYDISKELEILQLEVDTLKSSGATQNDSINSLDRLIVSYNSSVIAMSKELAEINKRRNSINQIISEIETEIETLNLNEEARRVFLSFDEVCSSNSCQLFSYSSDSYSKNLLYLKDQIKDLQRNTEIDRERAEKLSGKIKEQQQFVKEKIAERNETLKKNKTSSLVESISELEKRMQVLYNLRRDIDKVSILSDKFSEVSKERNETLSIYQALSSERTQIPELIKLRADLRRCYLKWLGIIRTINVNLDISFKYEFVPIFGKETISQLKGSTRTKAVLAYHAALLEVISNMEKKKDSFKFLIFDTPKQHEIHNDDLDNYFKELKELCTSSDIQIIFSTTEYHYIGNLDDKEWIPKYPGKSQDMFLFEVS